LDASGGSVFHSTPPRNVEHTRSGITAELTRRRAISSFRLHRCFFNPAKFPRTLSGW
jgi:hypothetical protein